MADAKVSKTFEGNFVRVRLPLPAPNCKFYFCETQNLSCGYGTEHKLARAVRLLTKSKARFYRRKVLTPSEAKSGLAKRVGKLCLLPLPAPRSNLALNCHPKLSNGYHYSYILLWQIQIKVTTPLEYSNIALSQVDSQPSHLLQTLHDYFGIDRWERIW